MCICVSVSDCACIVSQLDMMWHELCIFEIVQKREMVIK